MIFDCLNIFVNFVFTLVLNSAFLSKMFYCHYQFFYFVMMNQRYLHFVDFVFILVLNSAFLSKIFYCHYQFFHFVMIVRGEV